METIWYLLKCPEGNEADYIRKCKELEKSLDLQEVICFKYQRMLRYGGGWHLENRTLLPGYIFLSEISAKTSEKTTLEKAGNTKAGKRNSGKDKTDFRRKSGIFRVLPSAITPCKVSCLKELCSEDNLIGMSRGIIKSGIPVVTHGPLKGREHLIRKIDRHKRTAEIELRLAGQTERMVVGLEIYEKQT